MEWAEHPQIAKRRATHAPRPWRSHAWTHPTYPTDQPSVVKARALIRQQVEAWLGEPQLPGVSYAAWKRGGGGGYRSVEELTRRGTSRKILLYSCLHA